MKKRLFIALNFDAKTRLALAQFLHQLSISAGVARVRVDNLHLTLLFLGDTEEELIPRLQRELQQIAERFPPLSIQFGRLGGFPDLRSPHLIWIGLASSPPLSVRGGRVGLDNNASNLLTLQQAITERLLPVVPTADTKPFRPHLTIARIKTRPPGEVASSRLGETANSSLQLPPFLVGQIDLMESTLTPQGSIYRIISTHPLSAS